MDTTLLERVRALVRRAPKTFTWGLVLCFFLLGFFFSGVRDGAGSRDQGVDRDGPLEGLFRRIKSMVFADSPLHENGVRMELRGVGAVRGGRLRAVGSVALDSLGGEKGRSRSFEIGSETGWHGLRPGDRVLFATPSGGEMEGQVNLSMVDDGGWVRIGGEVEGGRFSLARRGEEIFGQVILPDAGVGFEMVPEGEGKGRVTERPLSVMICERTYQAAMAATDQGGVTTGLVPTLDSLPSAPKVIYLDFDGETVTDPAWNGGRQIVAAPARLTTDQMREVFNRVVEDYAPFMVSITTDARRYQQAAVGSRMRCIITPTSTAEPGAGGVAMMNSFSGAGRAFSSTVPCWVFNSSVAAIAESVSHEVGHTLGLFHSGQSNPAVEYFSGHGTGALSWGPIMGVPYSRGVTQWSKGEYRNANNRQDQVAIIQSVLGAVPDEAGGSISSGAPMKVGSDGGVSFDGVVGVGMDVDVYTFSTKGGAFSFQTAPVSDGANLDVALELRDDSGKIVVSANPEASLVASISGRLGAGRFHLMISGAAKGSPETDGYSRYGSVGRYYVTGRVEGAGAVVGVRPVVTARGEVKGVVGQSLEVAMEATGGVRGWTISGVLPAGLVFDGERGTIRGAPAVQGTYRVTVTALNDFGSDSTSITLVISGGGVSFGEALDNASLTFSSEGGAPWAADSSASATGGVSLRSGVIGDGGRSVLKTMVDGPTWVSFNWSVNSERNADILAVTVGGRVQRWISGRVAWETVQVFVPRPRTEVAWMYAKDADTSVDADAGWIDTVKVGNPPIVRGVVSGGPFKLGKPLILRADVEGGSVCRWMRNGRQISGVDGIEYRVESATSDDSGVYSVACTNDFGTAVSVPIWVDIQGPLRFLSSLQPTVARVGGRALLSVQVSQSSGVEFRWFFNGKPINFSGVDLPIEWAGSRVSSMSFRGASFLELSRIPSGAGGQISVEARSSSGELLLGGPVPLQVESLLPRYR